MDFNEIIQILLTSWNGVFIGVGGGIAIVVLTKYFERRRERFERKLSTIQSIYDVIGDITYFIQFEYIETMYRIIDEVEDDEEFLDRAQRYLDEQKAIIKMRFISLFGEIDVAFDEIAGIPLFNDAKESFLILCDTYYEDLKTQAGLYRIHNKTNEADFLLDQINFLLSYYRKRISYTKVKLSDEEKRKINDLFPDVKIEGKKIDIHI